MTKREQIVTLFKQGMSKTKIAKQLDTQYSYVWSVCQGINNVKVKNDSVSQQIRDLSDKGYDRSFISKKLNIDYSFVHNVLKRYKGEVICKKEEESEK